jgi:hypothetical protein
MATKKKTKKKPTKSKRTAGKKTTPKKKLAKKKLAPKKAAAKRKTAARKTIGGKSAGAAKKQTRKKRKRVDADAFSLQEPRARKAEQSGDLQGLSNVEGADSESVDELLEEGNAFEAGVVAGVEEADDSGVSEVHTHEVPEDDVPGEYLDKD